jgi:adenine/guanine/hypoxanthine permease
VFSFLSIIGFRKYIMEAIPVTLKFGIAVGIGLMICLVGLEWAMIVIDDPVTLIKVGKLNQPAVIVSGLGLLASMILTCLHIRGSILIGIFTSGIVAVVMGLVTYEGIFSTPPSIQPIFFAMTPLAVLKVQFISIIFVFLMIDLFDTVGTLVGVAELGGFTKQGGELPRARQALFSDSIATMAGAAFGTSTVTSYVESCSGISDGARTGLANIVTGGLFILAIFFAPVVKMFGSYHPIIAPALIMVGFMMMRGVKYINWEDPTDGLPAFLTIIFIAFSMKITEGIGIGIMSYTLLKLTTGKWRAINWQLVVLSILFAIQFFYLPF